MAAARVMAGLMQKWPARTYPDNTAAVFKAQRMTFREIDERINRCANALLGLGLQPSDRVAVNLRNCIDLLVIILAVERAGLAFVRLNHRETIEEQSFIVEDSGARVVVLPAELLPGWQGTPIAANANIHKIAVPSTEEPTIFSYERLLNDAAPDDPNIFVGYDDIRMIAYTSGTTGRPKGVVHTQGGMLQRTRNDFINHDILIDHTQVLLSVAPLSHGAIWFAHSYYLKGATNIIMDQFDVEETLAVIEKEKVTAFFMVPTMLIRLIDHPRIHDFDLSSIRRIFYAGAPMPLEPLQKAIALFGPDVFRQHFGSTEHPQPLVYLQPSDHVVDGSDKRRRRLYSVGRPVCGVEIKIVDDDGREAAVNEPGEIWARSDAGMQEYWQDPRATAATITDGWIHMGDIGRVDEDEYLYIVDRKKDMIISGGFNIYPREIERIIETHPAALEVAVFGIPDAEWGESVKAAVVLKTGSRATAAEIIELCRLHLGSYKKPKSVDFHTELPKNTAGKILKRILRDPYWKGRTRNV